MSKFIKKVGKGATDIAGDAIKKALSSLIGGIIKELITETGVDNVAKDKMMKVGLKIAKDMNLDPKKIQRDLLKSAIKKELGM
jgi:hypothetical protein